MQQHGRRNWIVPVAVLGGAAALLAFVLCVGVGFVTLRPLLANRTSPSPSPSPSRVAASPPAAVPPSRPPSECLIGAWQEVSYQGQVSLDGVQSTIAFTGGKGVRTWAANGTFSEVSEGTVYQGTASGDTWELVQNGQATLTYVADDKEIRYTNPKNSGTYVWKRNGKVHSQGAYTWITEPERYDCLRDELRLYGDDWTAVYKRIVPPGVPV